MNWKTIGTLMERPPIFDRPFKAIAAVAVVTFLAMAAAPAHAQSNCCEAWGGIGCENPDCTALICGQDSFCCDLSWDDVCADAANKQCKVCRVDDDDPVNPEGCIGDMTGDGTVGPMDLLELVASWGPCRSDDCPADLNDDGFVNTFDLIMLIADWGCVAEDDPVDPGDGDCCVANGTPGCEDAECEALVCAIDRFCCDSEWDDLCAGAADDQCGICDSSGGVAPPKTAASPTARRVARMRSVKRRSARAILSAVTPSGTTSAPVTVSAVVARLCCAISAPAILSLTHMNRAVATAASPTARRVARMWTAR